MIWDKLFWLWFAFVTALFLAMLTEEATTLNLLFGSMLIGLGLIKLAGERSGRDRPLKVSRKILKRLEK
jgi:hypothetical protein